jgi:hypothetical protein
VADGPSQWLEEEKEWRRDRGTKEEKGGRNMEER